MCPKPLAAPSDRNRPLVCLPSSGQTTWGVLTLGLQHTTTQVRHIPHHRLISINKKGILFCLRNYFKYNEKITKECTKKELLTRNGTHGLKSHTQEEHR